MKTRESGMPDEEMWAGFFHPERVLRKLGLDADCSDVLDFGCGYGTFAIPAATIVSGIVHALDIEPEMVAATRAKAEAAGLANVRAIVRDFVAEGSGLPPSSIDYAMLFNILHAERPEVLLAEAGRVLVSGGLLGIIHWNYDATTPRGPPLAIRPKPGQCRDWAERAGFQLHVPEMVNLPPYHYGWVLKKQ